jgi:hypothetical protein
MIGTTRQKPKILAAHRYIFAVNALIIAIPNPLRNFFPRFPRERVRVTHDWGGLGFLSGVVV